MEFLDIIDEYGWRAARRLAKFVLDNEGYLEGKHGSRDGWGFRTWGEVIEECYWTMKNINLYDECSPEHKICEEEMIAAAYCGWDCHYFIFEMNANVYEAVGQTVRELLKDKQ